MAALSSGCRDTPAVDSNVTLTSAEQTMATSARTGVFEREKAELAHQGATGSFEVVARFDGPMPTGVTVSKGGRIFVNYPRWGDPVNFTVAELRNGVPIAFPDADMNRWPAEAADGHPSSSLDGAARSLVSVQSVVVDPVERLWIVDTGSPLMAGTVPGGPKLVAVELATNRIVDTIPIAADVALKTSYLNDIRFDLRHGAAGFAFVTDSSGDGPNAIIVVDLATKKAVRRLNDHPSTKAAKGFVPIVEGKQLLTFDQQHPGDAGKPLTMGADGIAISADGTKLYYCPLASRHLYSVSVDALENAAWSDEQVAATVADLGEKGPSDGLESDAQGRIYLTDYEHNAITRTRGDGVFETVASGPQILWPDTLSLAEDGYLYFTANQLHRQPRFQAGVDRRTHPYVLFRTKVDGTPVSLNR